jgi:two-component system OmpR family sensor kinase
MVCPVAPEVSMMTLRTRLVVALVLLATLGLAVFGVVTYTLYQRSLFQQLDGQLTGLTRPQADRLRVGLANGDATASCTPSTSAVGPFGGNRPRGGFGFAQGLDAYATLYVDGTLSACVPALSTTGSPRIPAALATTDHPVRRTVGAATGSGSWRLLASPVDVGGAPGAPTSARGVVVVAVRTSGLDESMSRLVHIELAAAAGLLAALAIGAWLVLRRGLRPLEQMAGSASMITAGDLSPRVSPADEHTEVGQLGLALNTMLDGIEGAFREREATERRLRQFLADASHELRTPITSIQGFAELFRLAGERTERLDLPVIMRRIEQESGRMRTLVRDLFLLAELDEVRPVRREPVDLSVLAADACTDAVAVAPDRQVTLDAPAPVVVDGDGDHLRQAIANLVTNALRHTPADSPVEVSTRQADGWAKVTVRDHGPGLDADGLAHAFDRFWQADAARVGTGSGLGLSIVAGIAAEHGGRALVGNAPEGGASFTLELPTQE